MGCLPVVLNKQPRDTTVPKETSHSVAMITLNVISVEVIPTLPTQSAQLEATIGWLSTSSLLGSKGFFSKGDNFLIVG